MEDCMQKRAFGRTGIVVSEIGLGAGQLGNVERGGAVDEAHALRLVQRALDLGCNVFDTAPPYAEGRSEELLGKALKGVRSQVTICTKFGYSPTMERNFSAAALRPSLEASLRRLQSDYVDVYLLHNPPPELLDGSQTPHYAELEKLKSEGKLRVYGVSLGESSQIETVLDTTQSEAFEVFFNVFHQDPLSSFKRAQEKGVGLIVNVPLDSGWLSGKYKRESRFADIRARWSPEVIERRAWLVEQFASLIPAGTSITHAALQYILAYPQISTIIPGAKTEAQLEDSVAAANNRLTDDVVREMYRLWERELKSDPLPW
jgi:aryl-alcohol dehydrogenase-like predicted oxidoreductase